MRDKCEESLNGALKDLKKLMIESNAGQAMVKYKKAGVIGGWNFAIVVQTPDYDGDDKIEFN